MDLTRAQYAALHDVAFSDMDFIADVSNAKSDSPDLTTWRAFEHLLPPGPLLEIGPGSGHLLAAARDSGREVFAVEASAVHREYIVRRWGIPNVFAAIPDIPPTAPPFAAVVAFNTIEHVFDVAELFRSIRPHLSPSGAILVSTCNADCILLPLVGTYWAMFRPADHVSIPAADGLRALGDRTGFRCDRVWSAELPLETPVGILVALRDWLRERGRCARPTGLARPRRRPEGRFRRIDASCGG